jgi:L-lactate dehydrogenase complex protein LldF
LQYQALCRSATGQQCSVYLSMTSGPRRAGDVDGPEEFHVILLDNGRVDMLAKGYGEALCCIRCGACLNVCPVYREIGGHAYGSTYSGPDRRGDQPADSHCEVTDVDKLPYASSLCGACRDACPAKIDLPKHAPRPAPRRGRSRRRGAAWTAWGCKVSAAMMQSRARYEALGGAASWQQPARRAERRADQGAARAVRGMDEQSRLPATCQTQLPRSVAPAGEGAKGDWGLIFWLHVTFSFR